MYIIERFYFYFSSNEQSSKVKLYMMEILSSVVQEGENLSQEVMDAILVNVVEPNKVREERRDSSFRYQCSNHSAMKLNVSLSTQSDWTPIGNKPGMLHPVVLVSGWTSGRWCPTSHSSPAVLPW